MMSRRAFLLANLLIAAVGSVLGCSRATNPSLVPVSGTVLMDGKPLAGASVTFVAIEGTTGQGGGGTTDDAGNYKVSHFRAGEGLDPGEYKVLVSKYALRDGSPLPTGTISMAELDTRNLVPARYSDTNRAVLKATVKEGGEPIKLVLTSR